MSDVEAVIRTAVAPSAGDLLEARAEVLDALAELGSCNRETFEIRMLGRRGIAPDASMGGRVRVSKDGDGRQVVDVDDPTIVRYRIAYAVREAVGQLAADGLILQAAGSYYGPEVTQLPAEEANSWAGSFPIEDSYPRWGGDGWNSRWRLTRPANHPLQQLARLELAEGMEDLLGPRGITVLREAVRSFQRGLYLAAVDLLAAASEAAWFTLGSRVEGNAALRRSIKSGRDAGEVIAGTVKALRDGGILSPTLLTELHARAGHLRELRNYGLHPLGAVQDEHEEAFSEAGAALLFVAARSYFLRLREALEALEAQP